MIPATTIASARAGYAHFIDRGLNKARAVSNASAIFARRLHLVDPRHRVMPSTITKRVADRR